jgi:16S rRNA (uracil1498-N3)-methyltransferase
LFLSSAELAESIIRITGSRAHHLVNVLRYEEGAVVLMLDGLGGAWRAKVARARSQELLMEQLEAVTTTPIPQRVTLYQAIPKGDKMDWVVQKATELGVHRIVPCVSQHGVVKVDHSRSDAKIVRWQKIAEEAAIQCERDTIPTITQILHLTGHALPRTEPNLVLAERRDALSFPLALGKLTVSQLNIWVGPEGGFSSSEIDWFVEYGATLTSLGTRILRTETASLAALALCLGHFELMTVSTMETARAD